MKQEPKQQWARPQLIVLGRGRPEENVLLGCKSSSEFNKLTSGKHCNADACKALNNT